MYKTAELLRLAMKILTSTLFLLFFVPVVLACSYSSNPDPPIEYIVGRTESIYLGMLVQHKVRNKKEDGYKYKVHDLIFATEKVLKGAVKERFEVEIWERLNKRDSCYDPPVIPRIGESWIFHRNYREPNQVQYLRGDSRLFWRFDKGNERLAQEVSRIASIASNPRSTFFGQIEAETFSTLENRDGIRVELYGNQIGNTVRTPVLTETNSLIQGLTFKVEDLPPGKYTFRISAPKPLLFNGVYLGVSDIRMKPADVEGWFYADFTIEIEANRPEFHCFTFRQ